MRLVGVLAAGDFSSLNSRHFCNPSRRGLNLANSTDLIASVAGNTNVVVALKRELDVTDLEDFAAALFGHLACVMENLIDEGVGHCEHGL